MYAFKIGKTYYQVYDVADTNDNFDSNHADIEWYADSKGSMKTLRAAFDAPIPKDETATSWIVFFFAFMIPGKLA